MMLFKVDFEKAFDTISWKYLDFMLHNLGFRSTWRSWIKACLDSSRTSILINGSPTFKFNIRRGLRQGDPLSPFLFIIIMEGLHGILTDSVQSGLIRGITFGSSNLTLSHLFFADDVVITTDWSRRDMDNIVRVFQVFYLASGLKLNIHKSNIYGIGVSNDDVHLMASNTGCAAGTLPFTYLGLPIGCNMSLTENWKLLIDKFKTKLSGWKANLLSFGGRLTLIKSVLGSLGIYYLSIFKVAVSVLKLLEKMCASFFWGSSQDNKKLAWLKWPNVVASFEKGGLNIGSLKSFNLALLHKWRWRMYSNPNSLWVKVIKTLHGVEGGFDNNGCNHNGLWAKIVGSSNYLHSSNILPMDSIRFQVGCGLHTRFLKDIWLGSSPLCFRYSRLFRLEQEKDCLIIDRINNGQLIWNWSNNLGVQNSAVTTHSEKEAETS